MKSARGDAEHTLAVFIDFENLALGFNARRDRFQIEKVLERLVEKGKIVVKRAYCDWSRFGQYTGPLHESAIELIEIPKRHATGKNSADIRLVVDAIDLAYSKDHIDTFVIVSGDSDFSPLVSKLKELGKHVIGLGLTAATSELLRDNCDEFIYYEDLGRAPLLPVGSDSHVPEAKRKVFALLMESLIALRRENKEVIGASMVKDTMKRKKPSFNEGYHGYATFSELLEDAQKNGLVELEKHKNSGTYVVTRFGKEPRVVLPTAPLPAVPREPVRRPVAPPPPPEPRPQPREAAAPPLPVPDRGGRGRARPASPVAPPPPPQPAREPAPDRALGRALIDDIDVADDLDEVPSYAPKKAKPAPAAAKPSATPTPAPTPAKAPAGRRKPAAEGPVKPKAEKPVGRARPAAPPKPAALPQKPAAPAPKPVAPPKPAPPPVGDDDSGFGAGLDL